MSKQTEDNAKLGRAAMAYIDSMLPKVDLDVLTESGDMSWEEEAAFCGDNATWAVDEIRFQRAVLRLLKEHDADAVQMAENRVREKLLKAGMMTEQVSK